MMIQANFTDTTQMYYYIGFQWLYMKQKNNKMTTTLVKRIK